MKDVPLEVAPPMRRKLILPLLLIVSLLLNAWLWIALSLARASLLACELRVEALVNASMQQRSALDRALAHVGKMLKTTRELELNGCGRLLVPIARPCPEPQ